MRKRKTKKFNAGVKIVIVTGFLMLYLASMLLSTYLKKEQYRVTYSNVWRETSSRIYDELQYAQDVQGIHGNQQVYLEFNEDGTLSEKSRDFMEYIITNRLRGVDRYCLQGITISDMEGNLITKSADHLMYTQTPAIREGKLVFSKIVMEDYFTKEQMEMIRGYFEKETRYQGQIGDFIYDCLLYYDSVKEKLVYFSINEKELVKILNNGQHSYKSNTVFQWSNSEYEPIKHYDTDYVRLNTYLSGVLIYPYLHEGEDIWETWKETDILGEYVEKDEIIGKQEYYLKEYYGKGESASIYSIVLPDEYGNKHEFLIQSNVKTHPWQAAINDLQEIYIYGALFATLCLSIVLYALYQTYKKQEKLEETRRDFTNAVAHELKTPLTIVRGLVENMEEEESEEQKASYRKELVNQTEIMDDLVKEMIFISKLDSDKIILKEDQISVFSIMEDQMKKLEHPIEEKNLLVQYWKEEDFIIKGDKSYLEKAMFNLLENAVSHNKPNGKISISLEKDKCMIENTADAIEEENLPHICELFFTGDKSRNSDENHKGLGLYLVKKIFDLHGIELKIENTDIGVKVTIS